MSDLFVRPFRGDERIDNGDGTYSTQRTVTFQLPDGKWVNAPTLYKAGDRTVTVEDEDLLRPLVQMMMRRGIEFPTFSDLPTAEINAQVTSQYGGAAFNDPLKRK